MVNLGLDMSFFKNRLAMTVDVYRKKTTDLLIEKNAALATGYEKGWANIGAVRNQGIEITLDATPILTKKWNWTLNANIGFNRSKVLDIGPGDEMGLLKGCDKKEWLCYHCDHSRNATLGYRKLLSLSQTTLR